MQKIILCILMLLVSANVFAGDSYIGLLIKGANNGDTEAQYDLGKSYYFGIDVSQDYKQAVYWYQIAAEQGHAGAQTSLGFCYYSGYGVAVERRQAVYWFQKAAEQGNANAQHALGFCYAEGVGGHQNKKLAYMWYTLYLNQATDAVLTGYSRAAIEEIKQEMTESEIAEAQAMAAEWLKNH